MKKIKLHVIGGRIVTSRFVLVSQMQDVTNKSQEIENTIQNTWWYRTLHSYKLFWAVCHLFPQRWRTLTYSVSGNHWPGGPRDMFKTTSARKFKSCIFEPPTRRVFSINTSSSNTLVLFDQISSQQQHTPSSVNQQERKATPWMGLADIHIQ